MERVRDVAFIFSGTSSPTTPRATKKRGRNRPPQRVAFSTVVRSVLVVTAVSSVAIGTYFAFTDDVLTRLIGRQQNTYDDQIAKLRAQIDRIVSSQVLTRSRSNGNSPSCCNGRRCYNRRSPATVRDRHNQAGAHRSTRGNACRSTRGHACRSTRGHACRSTRGNACRSTRGNACRKTDDRIADQ